MKAAHCGNKDASRPAWALLNVALLATLSEPVDFGCCDPDDVVMAVMAAGHLAAVTSASQLLRQLAPSAAQWMNRRSEDSDWFDGCCLGILALNHGPGRTLQL